VHIGAVGVVVEGATVVTVVVTTVVKTSFRDSQARSPNQQDICIRLYYNWHVADELFDLDLLNEEDPFEIDAQAAHLFKHPRLGIEDIREV
jgi:hypothetical protein